MVHITMILKYDILFIHREQAAIGPSVFGWIVSRFLRKKVIHDFVDAIWLPDPNETNKLWQILKWKNKVQSMSRWSWQVSAGNEYLAEFARQYCDRVEVIPTVLDTEVHLPAGVTSDGGATGINPEKRTHATTAAIMAQIGDFGEGISTPIKRGPPEQVRVFPKTKAKI